MQEYYLRKVDNVEFIDKFMNLLLNSLKSLNQLVQVLRLFKTQRNIFCVWLNQTKYGLQLHFFDRFITKQNSV